MKKIGQAYITYLIIFIVFLLIVIGLLWFKLYGTNTTENTNTETVALNEEKKEEIKNNTDNKQNVATTNQIDIILYGGYIGSYVNGKWESAEGSIDNQVKRGNISDVDIRSLLTNQYFYIYNANGLLGKERFGLRYGAGHTFGVQHKLLADVWDKYNELVNQDSIDYDMLNVLSEEIEELQEQDQILYETVLINQDFNPFPHSIDMNVPVLEEHRQFIRNRLDEKGYVNADVEIKRVISVDLNNDGRKEQIIVANTEKMGADCIIDEKTANNIKNETDCVYAMIFIISDEEYVLYENYCPEDWWTDFGIEYFNDNWGLSIDYANFVDVDVFDFNNDGSYEIVINHYFWEGMTRTVYASLNNTNKFIPVLHSYNGM